MYCIKCGAQLEDGSRFCTVCGADQEVLPHEEPTQKPVERVVENKPTKDPGKSKTIIIIAVLAVIVAIVVFAVVTLNGNGNTDDNTAGNEDTQTLQDIVDDDEALESDEPEVDNSNDSAKSDEDSNTSVKTRTNNEIIEDVYDFATNDGHNSGGDGWDCIIVKADIDFVYSEGDVCIASAWVEPFSTSQGTGEEYGDPPLGWYSYYWYNKTNGKIKYVGSNTEPFDPSTVDMKTGEYIGHL